MDKINKKEKEKGVRKDMKEDIQRDIGESVSVKASPEEVTESVGDYLKMRREARGVSLKTVSKDTKISLSKLESLEGNDFDNLPNKIYLEGYIKSYAKSIGIVPDDCLRILHLTYQKNSSRRHLSLQEIPKANGNRRPHSPFPKMPFAFLGLALILLAILFFSYKKSSPDYSDTQQVPPVQLKSIDTEASFKMTPNKIVVEKAPSSLPDSPSDEEAPRREAEVADVPTPAENPPPSEEKVKSEEKKQKEKKIDFFPMKSSLYTIDTSIDPGNLAKMIPEKIQRNIASGKQNIYIKASRGDSWISYKADDRPIRNLTIKKDRDLLIRGSEVRVFFANINALDIFLNNRLLSISSSTGLKSVVFPQENSAKYVRPLFIYHDSGKVETSDEYLSRTQRGNPAVRENL